MTEDENTNVNELLEEVIDLPKSELGLKNHNNTHYFLCPLFGVKEVMKYKRYYVNSYIGDDGRESHVSSPLYCLFKYKDMNLPIVEEIEKAFQANPRYAFCYYAGSAGGEELVMYVLRAKAEEEVDYKHIINGRYSRVSKECNEKYRKFGFIAPTVHFINCITSKNSKFKTQMEEFLDVEFTDESELWNIFEEEREIFRYKK